MKKEFDNIQLINRKTDWQKNDTPRSYTALNDGSSIFAYFGVADYKMLVFRKNDSFQIEGDYIIYDELLVIEKSV